MEKEKDNFWDFNNYIIPKRTVVSPKKTDTSSINITIDGSNKQTSNYEKIPNREETKNQKSNASKGYSYKKENSLIKTVAITPWTGNVRTYEVFDIQVKQYYKDERDNCEYVPFASLSPIYSSFSKEQFAYYLFWRSELRKGIAHNVESSYIFVYLNECISSLNFITPNDVINNMLFIWKSYKDEYTFLDKYIFEYITDISLIHNIDLSFMQGDYFRIFKSLSLPEVFIKNDYSNITYSYIEELTNYSYKNNKYYKINEEAFDTHITKCALEAIKILLKDEEYIQNQALSHELKESFNGACVSPNNKNWIAVSYISLRRNYTIRQMFILIIKMCENYIRSYLGIKTKYSIVPLPPNSVCEYIKSYFDDNNLIKINKKEIHEKEPEYMAYYEPSDKGLAEAHIAKDIEINAWETAEILEQYIEYEQEPIIIKEEEKIQEDNDNEYLSFIKSLNSIQKEAIESIINNCFSNFIKENNIIKDELIRQINELAYDKIGDIVIEDDKIIEDYYDEISDAIKENN